MTVSKKLSLSGYESAPFFFTRQSLISNAAYEELYGAEDRAAFLWDYYQKDARFQTAIAVASPSLHRALAAIDKPSKSTSFSLLKYFLRAASRTTPFGLFAAVGYGEFAKGESEAAGDVEWRMRPDMSWITEISRKIHEELLEKRALKVAANPSIVQRGGKLYALEHYVNKKSPELLSIVASPFTKCVLGFAPRPIEIEVLLAKLLDHYGKESEEPITRSLIDLINKGFLISHVTPVIREGEILRQLKDRSKGSLQEVAVEEIARLCDENVSISAMYEALPPTEQMPYPVQVDAIRMGTMHLPEEIREVARQIPALLLACSGRKTSIKRLERFRQKFTEKYGIHVAVPIQEALREIEYEEKDKTEGGSNISHFFGRLAANIESVEVGEDLLDQIEASDSPLSCEVFFELLGTPGNYTLACNPHIATTEANSSMGRFLYLFDENVHQKTRMFAENVQALHEGVVHVEASFLPSASRTANVSLFKPIKQHHLPFGYPAESEETLHIDDIYLVANLERVMIYSKRLGRPLRVSISSAVNSTFAPIALQLMLDIGRQEELMLIPYPWWSHASEVYLPRMTYKNIILAPRRWRVRKEDVKGTLKEHLDGIGLPDQVLLSYSDHRLRLNWRDVMSFQIVEKQFEANKEATFFESLHSALGVPLKVGDACHNTEIALSCFLGEGKQEKAVHFSELKTYVPSEKRLLGLESNCLYAKLFLPRALEVDFIKSKLSVFIGQLIASGALKTWFFIRYREEGSHLRLRLFAESRDSYLKIYDAFAKESAKWLASESIKDVSIHAYEREMERYGGEVHIDSMESFFCVDSFVTTQILQKYQSKDEIPLFALAAVCSLLLIDAFFEDHTYLNRMNLDQQLLSGTRTFSKRTMKCIEALLLDKECDDEYFMQFMGSFQTFKRYAKELATELDLETKEKVADSLIHMHCNRLMGIDHDAERKARVLAQFMAKKVAFALQERH